MARIETDPNYTAPTFSRATAATDLFKKEDVQALAAAVSTHDHGAGTGVAVARIVASAIADGSITGAKLVDGTITSAKVADGTLTAADLVPGAISGPLQLADGAAGTQTTTSTTYVDMPGMAVNWTSAVAEDLIYLFWATLSHTSNTVLFQLAVNLDTTVDLFSVTNQVPATTGVAFLGTHGMLAGVAAGSHSLKGRWKTSSGTLTALGTEHYLAVLRLRR